MPDVALGWMLVKMKRVMALCCLFLAFPTLQGSCVDLTHSVVRTLEESTASTQPGLFTRALKNSAQGVIVLLR